MTFPSEISHRDCTCVNVIVLMITNDSGGGSLSSLSLSRSAPPSL